jgi:hypothetical protein
VVGIIVLLIPVVAVALLQLMAVRESGDSAYQVGRALGTLATPAVFWLIIYGLARALGKARSTAAKVHIGFAATVLTFLGLVGRVAGNTNRSIQQTMSQVVTDSERVGLTISSGFVRHARFGFTLPDPGPGFVRDSAKQQRMDSAMAHRGMAVWVLSSADRGEAIIVQVAKGISLDEVTFRRFANGIREGLTKTPGRILLDSLTWRGPDSECLLEFQRPDGVYFQSRCLPNVRNGISLIVCVQTVGTDRSDLEFVRRGLAFSNP